MVSRMHEFFIEEEKLEGLLQLASEKTGISKRELQEKLSGVMQDGKIVVNEQIYCLLYTSMCNHATDDKIDVLDFHGMNSFFQKATAFPRACSSDHFQCGAVRFPLTAVSAAPPVGYA